jgi:sugar phosphate isomerase/epimerase
MKLNHGLHLAYCTNVHPAETWAETLGALNRWTLSVKERLGVNGPYAIGLRLSDLASRELLDPGQLLQFQRWLEKHGCYVFTINGFPFGQFHGGRVKEQVYAPDWTASARLDYTNRLFDLLVELLPAGIEGSVSTLPGSFKEFVIDAGKTELIRGNLWRCVEHIARLSDKTGRALHLGLEPEPLGLFENTSETVQFFDQVRDQHPGDDRLERHLGVNYDTCHFAVEYEEAREAIGRLRRQGIRLSKIHLSNALKLKPSPAALKRLSAFADDVYLHQVIARLENGSLRRWKDLPTAIDSALSLTADNLVGEEWRVHFHVPLQCELADVFTTTSDHVVGVIDLLSAEPALCSHLEMETYTWAVLPEFLKSRDVVDQLVSEYRWTLARLAERGLAAPVFAAEAE